MSDTPYQRKRDFHGAVSGDVRVLASSTGLIPLVPTIPQHTIFIQTIHIEVTAPTAAEVWTLQDGAGVSLARPVSAAAVAHFDIDFGPDGVPCSAATSFFLNITGAVGSVGWIAWEGYKQFTGAGAGPAYSNLVLTDGASNYWRLNEKSGLTAFDVIGGAHGTISGGVTLGQPGGLASGDTAMAFDGVNGKIVTAGPVTLVPPWTYEAWFYYPGIAVYNPLFDTTGVPPAARDLLTFYVGPGNGLTWRHYLSGSSTSEQVQATLTLGWHHVVFITTTLLPLLYLDAVLTPLTGALTQPVGNASQSVEFGVITWQNIFMTGSLDEIAIYPYALTASQVRAHFQAASRP